MFIRRSQTRNRVSGEPYATYRLVHSARVGSAIKQITVLNLGSDFELPQTHWPALAQRIDELVHGQRSMLEAALPEEVQAFAQRFAAQIIARRPTVPAVPAVPAVAAVPGVPSIGAARAAVADPAPGPAAAGSPGKPAERAGELDRYQEVDLDSLELVDPRSVGVEHAALSAMRLCGLEDKLGELGLNRAQMAAALGNIVARMAQPCSELATHAWLKDTSGLGELIDFDFQAMDLNRLYRASDALYKHREALQEHLFGQAQSVFGLGQTITLYDLTNTYFEGVAAGVSKARRGHSKDGLAKDRSDCPLVTLAMALDASGFVRRVQFFPGNASEPATLKGMLTGLHAAPGATVVMDAGIAALANLSWLREQGYHYVVVSKLRERQFDPALATSVQSAGDVILEVTPRIVVVELGRHHQAHDDGGPLACQLSMSTDLGGRLSFLHSHSYTGNALACHAALAMLDRFEHGDVSQPAMRALADGRTRTAARRPAYRELPPARHDLGLRRARFGRRGQDLPIASTWLGARRNC